LPMSVRCRKFGGCHADGSKHLSGLHAGTKKLAKQPPVQVESLASISMIDRIFCVVSNRIAVDKRYGPAGAADSVVEVVHRYKET